ncbi:MAG TPA: hypothetical protein VFR14_06870 [Candidatus Limnocylindrales bacterium]|nr:hypothetical protein [Candidatus Limnocylindrales bacterium]
MTIRSLAVALCASVAVLAAIAAGAGVFLRGDLATEPFVTVRGSTVDVLIDGIYRYNGLAIAAEGVGWDLVTLFLVVPAFVLVLPGLRRGSVRARLAALGMLVYFLYQYLEYVTFLAYGPLFLVYTAIVGLSVSAIALVAADLDLSNLADRIGSGFPRRGVIGLALFIPLLLGGMWLPLVARSMGSAVVRELNGGTTLVVQAFDLGLLVPLGIFTAATLLRRQAIGYVLGAVVVVKAAAMGTAIAAMLVVEGLATGVWLYPPIVLFAAIGLLAIALAGRLFGSIGDPTAPSREVRPTTMTQEAPAR